MKGLEKIKGFIEEVKGYAGFWDIKSKQNIDNVLVPYHENSFFSFLADKMPTFMHRLTRHVGLSGAYGALVLIPANPEVALGVGYYSGLSLLLDKLSINCAIKNRERELEAGMIKPRTITYDLREHSKV